MNWRRWRHRGEYLIFRIVVCLIAALSDQETGSTWALDGSATAGPLAGERLQTRADAYTLFWFAWRHFQPDGSTFSAP